MQPRMSASSRWMSVSVASTWNVLPVTAIHIVDGTQYATSVNATKTGG